MVQKIFVAFIVIIILMVLALLMRSLLLAKEIMPKKALLPMILPDDFLLTIMLFFNLWISLLFLLVAHNLSLHDKQNTIIISALFIPLLFWWWRKKSSRKL